MFVIKYATLLLLWKLAGIPLLIGTVMGFYLVNPKEQKYGVVIWAPIAWVLAFFWVVFWIGCGKYFT